MVENRRSPRAEAGFTVCVREATGNSRTGEAVNLSPFGLRVRQVHIPASAVVRLDFELPGVEHTFSVSALAVRSDADGTAFAFINLARAEFLRLRDAVGTLLLRRKLSVMLVGGNRDLVEMLADSSEDEGYDVIVMSDPVEALTYLAHDQPDAILLVGTSAMRPAKFLQRLGQRGIQVPVVVLKPGATERDAKNYLQLGAWDFIRNPRDHAQWRLVLAALRLASYARRLGTGA